MRTAITILTTLILGFTFLATPVRSQNEDIVLFAIEAINTGLTTTFKQITATARRGNPFVGPIFQFVEDQNLPRMLQTVANMKADIEAQRLTLERAQGYFGSLTGQMDQMRPTLRLGVLFLPRGSARQILNLFEGGYKQLMDAAPTFYQYAKIKQG